MTIWIATAYAIGAVAEFVGIALIVVEFVSDRRKFLAWMAANPHHNEGGAWDQMPLLNKVVTDLLKPSKRRVAAVVLIAVGVAAGAVGNFLSLAT